MKTQLIKTQRADHRLPPRHLINEILLDAQEHVAGPVFRYAPKYLPFVGAFTALVSNHSWISINTGCFTAWNSLRLHKGLALLIPVQYQSQPGAQQVVNLYNRLTCRQKRLEWIHKRVSIWRKMNKSAALRIRIEPSLHQQFIDTCKAQDLKASQVLRDFMRHFVTQNAEGKQNQLFREDKE